MKRLTLQTKSLLFWLCLALSISSVAAQRKITPSPANTPSATVTPMPSETPLQTLSTTPTPNVPEAPHGDVLVFWATMGLVLVTGLLVLATYMLNRTTKEHVKHSRELVETVSNILSIDRMSRLTASINCDNSQEPRICLQNIGRVPVRISSLSIAFDSQPPESIISAQSVWILPLQAQLIPHRELAALWSDTNYSKIAIACTFQDVYSETDTQRSFRVSSEWTVDYGRRTMISAG